MQKDASQWQSNTCSDSQSSIEKGDYVTFEYTRHVFMNDATFTHKGAGYVSGVEDGPLGPRYRVRVQDDRQEWLNSREVKLHSKKTSLDL